MVSKNKYIKGRQLFENDSKLNNLTKEQISYLKWHIKRGTFKFNEKTGLVDVFGDVDISKNFLTDLTFIPWGEIDGNFRISYMPKLTSLKGAPVLVTKRFSIHKCPHLESLDYCTKDIGGAISLEGNAITSLKGCPKIVNGFLNITGNKLTNLKYCPEIIEGNFYCSHNILTSLEGSPKKVDKTFACDYNKLTSLEGVTDNILHLNCSNNNISSFRGLENMNIKMIEIFKDDNLTSLEGIPKNLKTLMIMECKNLLSLKGLPRDLLLLKYSSGPSKPLFMFNNKELNDPDRILSLCEEEDIFKSLLTPDLVQEMFNKNLNEAVLKIKNVWNYLIEEYPEINKLNIPIKYKNILDALSIEGDFGF